MIKENILVTGGSGFIGSNLVDQLILDDHSVTVIDDLSTGLKANENISAEYIYQDLTKLMRQENGIDGILAERSISTVYHLAASADIQLSMDFPEQVYETNLTASLALANACARKNVNNFVFASTSVVFGDPSYLPVDELHSFNPISPYGLSKLNFEQYLTYFSQRSEVKFTVLRFPNIYGKRQREDLEGGVVAIFKGLIDSGKPIRIFGDGNQTRDWVHVVDIVNALIKSKELKKKLEIINLGSRVATSLNDFVAFLSDLGKFDGQVINEPCRIGDIKHMVLDDFRAKDLLGWKAEISFRSGIEKLWSGS
jgi:UDP-glucose 4-epimerase